MYHRREKGYFGHEFNHTGDLIGSPEDWPPYLNALACLIICPIYFAFSFANTNSGQPVSEHGISAA